MAIAYQLNPDLTVKHHEFTVGDSYDMLSNAVEGYIECARITPTLDMWLNEEGKMNGLEVNEIATAIFWSKYGFMSDIIVGNVVFAGNDNSGETIGLSEEDIEFLKGFLSFDETKYLEQVE
jgi:hypothetical protein